MRKATAICLFIAAILTQNSSCTKDPADTCRYDACDPRRKTVATVTDWDGQMIYFDNLQKWAINHRIPDTYDSTATCIICGNIADSFKTAGRTVIFSGAVKEGCGSPKPATGGQGIYYISPTKLR